MRNSHEVEKTGMEMATWCGILKVEKGKLFIVDPLAVELERNGKSVLDIHEAIPAT
jgi:hypothetical protein